MSKDTGSIFSTEETGERASRDLEITSTYTRPPYFTEVNIVTDKYGNIPEEVYSYCTNPWIPINEYLRTYEEFPISINKIREIPEHYPFSIYAEEFNSTLDVAWYDSLYRENMIHLYFPIEDKVLSESKIKRGGHLVFNEDTLCTGHLNMNEYTGWDDDKLTYKPVGDCIICEKLRKLWSEKILSTHSDDPDRRREYIAFTKATKDEISNILRDLDYTTDQINYMIDEEGDFEGIGFLEDERMDSLNAELGLGLEFG
jgi:hypothetical protein